MLSQHAAIRIAVVFVAGAALLGCELVGSIRQGVETAVENRTALSIIVGSTESGRDRFFVVGPLETKSVDTVGDGNVPADLFTILNVACQPQATIVGGFGEGALITVAVVADPQVTPKRTAPVRRPKPEDVGAPTCEEAAKLATEA